MSEPTPLVEAVLLLHEITKNQWDEWTNASPENARLRIVATAIFHANWGTLTNADEPVMGIPYNATEDRLGQTQCYLGKGTVAFRLPIQPAWATYLKDARDAIAAVDAAK